MYSTLIPDTDEKAILEMGLMRSNSFQLDPVYGLLKIEREEVVLSHRENSRRYRS